MNISIIAPARKVTFDEMSFAFDYIRSRGHNPVYDERLFDSCNQFAGDDDARAALIQEYLDRDDIDVMLCARSGYGTVRIIDKLNFEKFLQKPKWIAGYSDVTVLHAKLQKLGCESLHSTMPINFADNTKESLDSLFDAIEGKRISYEISSSDMNIFGKAEAQLVGGNISVLYSLLGSDIFPDTDGKILFLEDLDEYLYHIDRMMTALQRAGKLDNIKGLIVGGLTKMHDNNIPFGMSAEEIILEKVKDKNIPVCFNFPAGHIDDNRSLVLGRTSYLEVKSETSKIEN
jgi:muramoyltetrapeptide carboxypeptidase